MTVQQIRAEQTEFGGAWESFTAISSGITIGDGVSNGYYIQIGKTVHFYIDIQLGSTSSVSGTLTFNVPAASVAHSGTGGVALNAYCRNAGQENYIGHAYLAMDSSTFTVLTIGANTSWSDSVPFSFGNGDSIKISGTYEIA